MKLVLLFCGEFGRASFPHFLLFLFYAVLKVLSLSDIMYRGSIIDVNIRVYSSSYIAFIVYKKHEITAKLKKAVH